MIFVILFLFFIPFAVNFSQTDSSAAGGNGFIALPFIYYTPETEFALGAGGYYYFRDSDSPLFQKPSRLNLAVTYTTKKQFMIEFTPFFYLDNEEYYIESNLSFGKFPFNFYGIGNNVTSENEESYSRTYYKIQFNVQKRIADNYKTGILFDFIKSKIKDFKQGGILESGSVTGSNGGLKLGIGLVLTFDSRDNINSASSGGYYELRSMVNNKFFGSDFDFVQYKFDLRRYLKVADDNVIAFQFLGNLNTGSPSFEYMAALGGPNMMRGYYEGRYRDNNLIAFQTEFRVPAVWRIGIAGFLGAGGVASNITSFAISDLKYSAGIGFRFSIDENEKLNLRADYGFGKNSSALYFTVGEAF